MTEKNSQGIFSLYKEWKNELPLERGEYFFHLILILDCALIFIKNSYESFFPDPIILLSFLLFDIFVASVWGIEFIIRLRRQNDKVQYLVDRWYNLVGLAPFPIFRLLLLLVTLRQGILIWKYIQRGEKDKTLFANKELHFTFRQLLIDSISDAVYLNSLKRVEEVVNRLEFDKITKAILEKHEPELKKAISASIKSKSSVGRLESFPLFNGISDQLSADITRVMIETMETETIAQITKELNLVVIKEMESHVKKLGLDRIRQERIEDD